MNLLLSDDGFAVEISGFRIPLSPGHVERELGNILLALRGGIASHKIATHFLGECDTDLHCPCCKLEGRILRGQGRRALSAEDRLRAASRASHSGSVQIRRTKYQEEFHNALRKAWCSGSCEALEDLI